jgi:hypothetical protein
MIRTPEFEFLPSTVISLESLKAKPSCCKSACMNCPYGYTVKKHGLLFKKIDYDQLKAINRYFSLDIGLNYKSYELVILKGYLVAIAKMDEMFVQEMLVHPLIHKTVITKELVESYYFY